MKEGLPLRPWAADLVKSRRATNSKDNPDAHCLPMGLMQFHNHGQPRKMVVAEFLGIGAPGGKWRAPYPAKNVIVV